MAPPNVHKACDPCRSRKIRCKFSSSPACEFCTARGFRCVFSKVNRPIKRKLERLRSFASHIDLTLSSSITEPCDAWQGLKTSSTSSAGGTASGPQPRRTLETYPGLTAQETPELYLDFLLANRQSSHTVKTDNHMDQLTVIFGPNPNISFFPANRVRAISQKLGNHRLERLLEAIRDVVAAKMKTSIAVPEVDLSPEEAQGVECVSEGTTHELMNSHIQTFFQTVHPLFPFLCPQMFKQKASAPDLSQGLAMDKTWAGLYYAVVAIGCQYGDGGSFEAGQGEAWSYFEKSVSFYQDIVLSKACLISVQPLYKALIAMALFSSSVSAFQFDSLMLSEAAVMAQRLGLNRSSPSPADHRTFWVLYYMEKSSCFATGKIPVLQDSFIGCPIPQVEESRFEDYDWFFTFLKYARLVSKIHSSLFTISSVPKHSAACSETVPRLRMEVEAWRMSIPLRFRPGEPLKRRLLPEPLAVPIALLTHYYYLNAVLTLSWTFLHAGHDGLSLAEQLELKKEVMHTARKVLELTEFIEVSPSTPVWILAVMPLSALMILFDLMIHNPLHPETSLSLALLDIASGHFSRIEFASKGTLPGSLIAEFAHLARRYVSDVRAAHNYPNTRSIAPPPNAEPPRNVTLGRLHMDHRPTSDLAVDDINSRESSVANASRPPPQGQVPLPQSEPVLSSAQGLGNSPIQVPVPLNPRAAESHSPLFFPTTDDPSYQLGDLGDLRLLGVDLMGLFDTAHPLVGEDGGL
ncbi:hypothetical protein BBP40_006724 [Aspergillus hancockii]|nr:hypothetical protein BBP40_006724 [Aspergillus hancockii]